MGDDKEQIQLLSIFHYIVGGLTALFSCMPFLHIAMGIAMLSGAFDGDGTSDAPPRVMGLLFIILPAFFVLCGWALSVCMIVAGRKLSQLKSRTFCLVIAGIECIIMPFGTALGVFTLIVLMRESARELFNPTVNSTVPPELTPSVEK